MSLSDAKMTGDEELLVPDHSVRTRGTMPQAGALVGSDPSDGKVDVRTTVSATLLVENESTGAALEPVPDDMTGDVDVVLESWRYVVNNTTNTTGKQIIWDEYNNWEPDRMPSYGDLVPDKIATGWRRSVTKDFAIDPSGAKHYLDDSGFIVPLVSGGRFSYVCESPSKPTDIGEMVPRDKRQEADGDHFGENSVIIPRDRILDASDLWAGGNGHAEIEKENVDHMMWRIPDSDSVRMTDVMVDGGTPASYGVINVTGSYHARDVYGNTAEYDHEYECVLAARPRDGQKRHTMGGTEYQDTLDLKEHAGLKSFLDSTLPLGDSRAMTGLSQVINTADRTSLHYHIRHWLSSGMKYGKSETGYVKLWLYVFALDTMDSFERSNPNVGWQFAPAAGDIGPHWENISVDRRVWDASGARIQNGQMGWMMADPDTGSDVANCMADFYKPFPSWTASTQNGVPGVRPIALGHDIPGITETAISGRSWFGVAAGAGGVYPNNVPARARTPTQEQYIEAIRQLAAYRYEEQEAVMSFYIAALLSACRMGGRDGERTSITGRQPQHGIGFVGQGIQWPAPLTNTLCVAYVKGTIERDMPKLAGLVGQTQLWRLRNAVMGVTCYTEAIDRMLQTCNVSKNDLHHLMSGTALGRSSAPLSNYVGKAARNGKFLGDSAARYLWRTFGIKGCSRMHRFIFYAVRVWPVVRDAANNIVPYDFRVFTPEGRITVWYEAREVAMFRKSHRIPWFWEVNLAGVAYAKPGLHKMRMPGRAGHYVDYIHTSITHTDLELKMHFTNVAMYQEALYLKELVKGVQSTNDASTILRLRPSEAENTSEMDMAATSLVIPVGAFNELANSPWFKATAVWHMDYDHDMFRSVRYEATNLTSRITNAQLSEANKNTGYSLPGFGWLTDAAVAHEYEVGDPTIRSEVDPENMFVGRLGNVENYQPNVEMLARANAGGGGADEENAQDEQPSE